MSGQISELPDLPTMEQAFQQRDDGLARVEANADPEFLKEASDALKLICQTQPELHADDLWSKIAKPREGRAAGAVWTNAKRDGWIMHAGYGRPSASSNGSYKPIWISLIYEGDKQRSQPLTVMQADIRSLLIALTGALMRVPAQAVRPEDREFVKSMRKRYGIRRQELEAAL